MVLVRIVFQTKWGKAHEVVEGMKESLSTMQEVTGPTRLLTDLSGPFHRVIQEIEVESLGEWERRRPEIFAHPEFQERQARIADLIESGSAEFYSIET